MAVKSSFKNMTLCLLVICLVCSGLLAGVYVLTKDTIESADKSKNEAAIKEVLPKGAVSFDEEKEVSLAGKTYTYVAAYDVKGNLVGYAIDVTPVGFGGPIKIKVGFNAEGVIWNTKVLSQSETPGLGAKCTESSFADQFKQFNPAEKSLKVTKDGGDVNAITASTITSRAYAEGLETAVKVYHVINQTPMPLTDESTEAADESMNEAAIKDVLPNGATSFDEEKIFSFGGKDYKYVVARDDNGNFVGCAIDVEPNGFNDLIKIKVGFNAEGVIWNTMVLSQSETPGFGAKCTESSFADQFKQFNPAEKSLKLTKDGGDVDAITGSTITSRAYAEGLATAVKVFQAIGQTPMPLNGDVIPSDKPSVIPSEVEESK